MATQGQIDAANQLAIVQGQSAQDWIPQNPTGNLPGSNISNAAYSNQQYQYMLQAPEGTYSGSQMQQALDAANQVAAGGNQSLGQANYNDQLNSANANVQWWNDHPNGNDNWMDTFMGTVFPAIVLGGVAGYAGGLFGDAAGAGAGFGSAGGEVGLGGLGVDSAALQNLGFLDTIGGAAGAEAGAGLGGTAIGAGVGAGGIPSVTITGAAPTGGMGLGAVATGAGALGLAGLAGGGGNPPAPPQDPNDPNIPAVVVPGTRPPVDPIGTVSPGNIPIAPIPYLPPGSVQPGSGTGTPAGGVPSGLPGLGNLLGGLLGGNVDHIKAQQDADWWKSQLDTLQGMYKPGTPEADLMESKMRAKDAAAGRNSQYGIRATDLAAQLADKRANIMTSAGYQNMANAYRNRSSQDLNGLFSAMGQAGGLGNIGSLISQGYNGISSLFGGGSTTPTVNVTPPVR